MASPPHSHNSPPISPYPTTPTGSPFCLPPTLLAVLGPPYEHIDSDQEIIEENINPPRIVQHQSISNRPEHENEDTPREDMTTPQQNLSPQDAGKTSEDRATLQNNVASQLPSQDPSNSIHPQPILSDSPVDGTTTNDVKLQSLKIAVPENRMNPNKRNVEDTVLPHSSEPTGNKKRRRSSSNGDENPESSKPTKL